MDAIVIEDIVAQTKARLITWATNFVWAKALIAAPWLSYISFMIKPAIRWVVTKLITEGEFGAFVINTRLLTSSQASDYVKAAIAVRDLPEDISDEQWTAKEEEANRAFDNLIRYAS